MIFSGRTWLAGITLSLVLSGILLLPYPYRDAMLVAVFLAALVGTWFQPDETWFAFLLLLPLVHLSGGLFQNVGLILSRMIVVGMAIVLLVKHRDTPALRALAFSDGFRFFGVFILANLIAAAHTLQTSPFVTTLTYLEPLLFFALSYYLVRRNPANTERFVSALVIGGGIAAAVGLYEIATQQSVGGLLNPALKPMLDGYLVWDGSDRFGIGGRISSLIGPPAISSLYFVLILIVTLYQITTAKRARWLVVPTVIVGVVLILATGTRAALLALAAAGLVVAVPLLRTWRQRLVAAAVVVSGVALAFLLLPKLGTYLVASLDVVGGGTASANVTGRIALTMELLRIFRANWLFGYGPGLVQKQAAAGILPTVPGIKSLGGIENQYATILADGGILAGLSYLLFMVGALWEGLRVFRDPRWRAMGLTLLALLVTYFVFAATEMMLTILPNLVLMAIFGAFAARFESSALTTVPSLTPIPSLTPSHTLTPAALPEGEREYGSR